MKESLPREEVFWRTAIIGMRHSVNTKQESVRLLTQSSFLKKTICLFAWRACECFMNRMHYIRLKDFEEGVPLN
jgi:hypothetical protein